MFTDLKVLELANVLAGPSVGMFFAELGATVYKVENKATNGDITRSWKLATEPLDASTSAYYHSINYGKESFLLDLNLREDLDRVMALVATCDILVSNYTDQAAKRFGLDYVSVKAIKPNVIYAQLYAFADQADTRPAFDIVLQAEAGFLSMSGHAGQPTRMPVALIDLIAGHQLKEAILIALLKRERTGKGSLVRTSLLESAVASLANQAANWLHAGSKPQPMGMQHPNIAPYGDLVYASDHEPIVLACGTEKHFIQLATVLGMGHLSADHRFATNTARVSHREALMIEIQTAIKTQPAAYWMELFAEASIPAGRIMSIPEVFETPSAKAMILEQTEADGSISRRVKTIAFHIS
jgi:crotonobetainyl-CoA:carnitine CoA-transferase CaiB-like acyl-CoA transferase